MLVSVGAATGSSPSLGIGILLGGANTVFATFGTLKIDKPTKLLHTNGTHPLENMELQQTFPATQFEQLEFEDASIQNQQQVIVEPMSNKNYYDQRVYE